MFVSEPNVSDLKTFLVQMMMMKILWFWFWTFVTSSGPDGLPADISSKGAGLRVLQDNPDRTPGARLIPQITSVWFLVLIRFSSEVLVLAGPGQPHQQVQFLVPLRIVAASHRVWTRTG